MNFPSLRPLVRLWPWLQPERRDLALAGASAVLLMLATLGRPMVMRYVIDDAVPRQDPSAMALYGALFVALVVVSMVVDYAQVVLMARLGLRLVNRLKAELCRHLLGVDLAYFNERNVGWLISRVEGDAEQIKQFCGQVTVRLVMDALVFLGVAVTIVLTDLDVALGVLTVDACIFGAVLLFFGRLRTLFDDVRARMADLTGFIAEYVQGIPVLQLYNRERDAERELAARNDAHYRAQNRAATYEYSFWSFLGFLTESVLVGVILWIGLAKYGAGTMTIGKLVMLVQLALEMTWPLHSFSENLGNIQRSLVSCDRVFGILDVRPTMSSAAEVAGARPTPLAFTTVEFRAVSFRYGQDDWALRNLSFTLRRGETLAIVGPSGAGKTTLVNLLCRFYDPTEGRILVDGRDLRELDPGAWRAGLGLVLQEVFLFPGTVLDNVRVLDERLAPEAALAAARRLGAEPFIQRLPGGLQSELAERGMNLSMGERQLLGFTRAMVHDPALLILDEATSSVDRHTEALLQAALERLLEGRTAVVIAHRLQTVRRADRIMVLKDGAVAEVGDHASLMLQGGLYHRLYSLQAAPPRVEVVAT